VTSLVTSLREVITIKICYFRYKENKKQKPVTSEEPIFVVFVMYKNKKNTFIYNTITVKNWPISYAYK